MEKRTRRAATEKQHDRYQRVRAAFESVGISEARLQHLARAYWARGGLPNIRHDDRHEKILRHLAAAHKLAHQLLDPTRCRALQEVDRLALESSFSRCVSHQRVVRAIGRAGNLTLREFRFREFGGFDSEWRDPEAPEIHRVEVLETVVTALREHVRRRAAMLAEDGVARHGAHETRRLTQEDAVFALLMLRRAPEGVGEAGGPTTRPIDDAELRRVHARMKADLSSARRDGRFRRE